MLSDPTGLHVDTSTDAGVAVLLLSGELDADSADAFVADASHLIEQGYTDLVLGCAAVTFCDSFGLRAMTLLADRLHPDGSLTITQPSEMLTRILDITGLAERLGLAREAS